MSGRVEGEEEIRIIPFEPRDQRPPVVLKPRDYAACPHKGPIEVDEINRTVTCVGCSTPLDPVMVLVQMAHGYRSQDYQIEALRKYEEKIAEHNRKERERNVKRRRRMEAQGMQFSAEPGIVEWGK